MTSLPSEPESFGTDWPAQELLLMREVMKLVGRSLASKLVLREMLYLMSELLGLNRGRIVLVDNAPPAAGERTASVRHAYGLTTEEAARGVFRWGEGITGRVLAIGLPSIVQDVDAEPLFLFRTVSRAALPEQTVAFIALSILVNGATIGVLACHRCCYHGWLFDAEGHCLDQPCEPDGGEAHRHRTRQPWYPLQERYGLIFAYMGPPEKKPLLPRYDALEELDADEFIDVDDTSIGSGGGPIAPCNWLQHYENVIDPFHVPILHGTFSGTQFTPAMNLMPQVQFDTTDRGVKVFSTRQLDGGKVMKRTTEVLLPTLRVVPNPFVGKLGKVESIGWTVPIDDMHYRIYTAARVTKKGEILPRAPDAATRPRWDQMTPEQRRETPNDWEAQVGQGPITLHGEEHLATSDRGIVMLRRLLARQVEAVERGEDPIGVHFDEASAYVRLEAGQYVEPS